RVVAGVAAGVADQLHLPVLVVRIAFAVLATAQGVGVVAYAALWFLVPLDPQGAQPAARRSQHAWVQLVSLGALTLGGMLLLSSARAGIASVLPLLLAAAGVAVVWRQADEAQRRRWLNLGTRGALLRAVLGVALLLAGLAGFLAARGELGAARDGLVSTGVVVAGLALLAGPWVTGTLAELGQERRARIRSQERAEVAAHVHDSVLQTLALIRKAADDPREVSRLARSQERELRSWLYGPVQPAAGTLAGALEQAVAAVEEATGMAVESVVVGDLPLDEPVTALVAGTREALLNAAKHAGVPTVSLYAEVGPDRVEVFVRDRGRGFVPELVPQDRMGLAESVVGRMARHGGKAVVVSGPGEGTEVRLELPRD
ncbi:MAG: putative signal transduction histidine kinase, partial [Frankiales bacterium]|nr:putative signal transduction histidine kinase [Frankiales bacterium]